MWKELEAVENTFSRIGFFLITVPGFAFFILTLSGVMLAEQIVPEDPEWLYQNFVWALLASPISIFCFLLFWLEAVGLVVGLIGLLCLYMPGTFLFQGLLRNNPDPSWRIERSSADYKRDRAVWMSRSLEMDQKVLHFEKRGRCVRYGSFRGRFYDASIGYRHLFEDNLETPFWCPMARGTPHSWYWPKCHGFNSIPNVEFVCCPGGGRPKMKTIPVPGTASGVPVFECVP